MDIKLKEAKSDEYASLARKAVEEYVLHHSTLPVNPLLPEEMLQKRAGVFVSIHENGELRGCIGTTRASEKTSPRKSSAMPSKPLPKIRASRQSNLKNCLISTSPSMFFRLMRPLPPTKILTSKSMASSWKRGRRGLLLLPNLDGVDTVEQQIAIAKRKAGIAEEERVTLYRFEVVRHE
jgi:AMMECR1 domain-containing protein